MNKKNKTILLSIFVFFLSISFYFLKDNLSEKEPFTSSQEEEIPQEEFTSSDRAEKFFISSAGEPPVFFKEIITDPFEVREGEEQVFSVWVKDPKGIERVTASVSTDKDSQIIEMEIKQGTRKEGRWQGSWIVSDISSHPIYETTFKAFNFQGEEGKFRFSWKAKRE